MKERFLKWMKRYGVTVWLVAAVLALAVSASYAAYVNLDIKKHVLTTGRGNQAFFSSNYLYLTDYENQTYDSRLIATSKSAGKHEFTVMVCNHVYGNEELVNLDDIQYTFQVQARSINGSSLPVNITGVTIKYYRGENQDQNSTTLKPDGSFDYPPEALPGETATKDFFRFSVPDDLKDAVYFIIEATPQEGSRGATNDQKLAAIITLTDNAIAHGWSGQFLDLDDRAPNQYSGFNYEIRGSGEATVTLSWDSSVLEISPWFKDDVKGTSRQEGNVKTLTFDTDNEKTAYQLQFYIANKAGVNWNDIDWAAMSEYVKVSYEIKSSAGSTENTTESNG